MNPKRKVKVIAVTPELATRWLEESNTHNRPIRDHVVDKYAAAMKRGEWKLTPEPIAFSHPFADSTGASNKETLINGQHRLWAVIKSNCTVEFTVWWGCEPDEFEVIDQGATRTFGDVLSTTRVDLKDPTLVASVCSSAARFAFGYNSKTGALRQAHISAMLTAMEPNILAAVDYKKRLRKIATRPVVSTLLLAHIVNPSMTDLIVNNLKEAIGFTEKCPIRALHLYLQSQHLPGNGKDSYDMQHYKVCHAITCRLRGEHIKVLRITGEGLGWLRDAARTTIHPVVQALFDKTPHNFYSPKLVMEDKS